VSDYENVEWILVRIESTDQAVGSALCKEFEDYDGVTAAAIVRKGSNYAKDFDYMGEFYSTGLAVERLNPVPRGTA
jgi:hypothetical protein